MNPPLSFEVFSPMKGVEKVCILDDDGERHLATTKTPQAVEMYLRLIACVNACMPMEDPQNEISQLYRMAEESNRLAARDWDKEWFGRIVQGHLSYPGSVVFSLDYCEEILKDMKERTNKNG